MCVSPIVGGAKAQGVLGLESAHWWVKLVLELMLAHWSCRGWGSQSWYWPTGGHTGMQGQVLGPQIGRASCRERV